MSLSQNLQNILDETFQSFLAMDLSSNLLQQINHISPVLLSANTIPNNHRHMNIPENNETESLPDLIPIEEPTTRREVTRESTTEPIDDSTRRIRLWSNILLDYHNQINTYQENMRAVFNITEHILPISETRSHNTYSAPAAANNSYANRLWQSLLRNPTSYILELDTTNLLTGSGSRTGSSPRPTAFQIQSATSLFSYNPQENPLTITTCPITLEEFREDEILMRINGCGHIFKATALHRWFERNHKCPSCRYDILSAAFSLPPIST